MTERGAQLRLEGDARAPNSEMTEAENKARYRAWADRLRSKQRTLIADSRPATPVEAIPEKAPGAFDFDLLETGSATSATTAPRDTLTVLLDGFGLPADATMEDAAAAYHGLVKAHHPDQHETADRGVRERNELLLDAATATYRAIAAALADAPPDADPSEPARADPVARATTGDDGHPGPESSTPQEI